MAGLFIRDEAVNDLAVEVMKITGASSKTEAIGTALQCCNTFREKASSAVQAS
ncbi:hypothetical protein D2T29_21340 [Sinirhodobacter populi]|uniref:Type II toxin-antitoxin system VapB family antitoxin n=1 Tax=Paenirhodobacter populi TaxID=2306993 RepID=A0A443K006_9RHOB|nr:type II toxin-antitoxin system VapB family antitoxin [Sinirhodobacter populi]RWR26064.1 hypothetical protein D2T29_21340 [Sinirhodobacter populi]